MFSLVHTSSIVILSFRGMFRNASKSTGIALRPTLPFFRLETTTGTEFASCILPLFLLAELTEYEAQIAQQQL
jgi:hypothetical protein